MDVSEIGDCDIVYYVAASIDGYIADANGGVDWLNPYFSPELGFEPFMKRMKGSLMGRATFDKMGGMMGGGGQPAIVATNRPLKTKGKVVAMAGTASELASAARDAARGPVWLIGGGGLAAQLLEAGELDRVDLFTIPVILGGGIPAFRTDKLLSLELASTGTYPKGITRHTYRPAR
jgi:dihydrofolate reductase